MAVRPDEYVITVGCAQCGKLPPAGKPWLVFGFKKSGVAYQWIFCCLDCLNIWLSEHEEELV